MSLGLRSLLEDTPLDRRCGQGGDRDSWVDSLGLSLSIARADVEGRLK